MVVYRIDTDGNVSLIVTDAGMPNGILVSPDQRTLYVGTVYAGKFGALPRGMSGYPGRQALLAYDLREDGSVVFRDVVVDLSGGFGPDGSQFDHIPLGRTATNVTFGCGETSNTLYITGGKNLYGVELKKEGYNISCH